MTSSTQFSEDDHRNYNRSGDAFDVGETFAGVGYDTGLAAAEDLRDLVPDGVTMAQLAIRWILMHPAVSTVIPGAKRASQAIENTRAALLPMDSIADIYERLAKPSVHHRW